MTTDAFTPAEQVRVNRPNDPEETVRRDTFGRYLLPRVVLDGEPPRKELAWTRATTFAKSISDTFSLSAWSQRMVAVGVARNRAIRMAVEATPITDRDTLNGLAEQAKEWAGAKDAARMGTAVHKWTEVRDAEGDESNADPDIISHLDAYTALVIRAGLEMVETERIVAWSRYQIAGKFDRIALYQGRPVIVDVKTGRDLSYGWNEIAIQLAVYANADGMWDPQRWRWEPMPEGLDRSTALVIHLPIAPEGTVPEATLYEVDLEPAVAACDLCARVREWRKTRNLAVPVLTANAGGLAEPLSWQDRIKTATSQGELSAIWREATAAGEWTPELKALGLARLGQLRELAG